MIGGAGVGAEGQFYQEMEIAVCVLGLDATRFRIIFRGQLNLNPCSC